MAPARDGKVVPPDEFNAWPEAEQQEMQAAIEELEKDLEDTCAPAAAGEGAARCGARARPRHRAVLPSPSRSTKPRPRSPTCRRSSSTSRRCAPIWSRTSPLFVSRARTARARPAAAARQPVRPLRGQRAGHPDDDAAGRRSSRNCIRRSAICSAASSTSSLQGALVTNFRLIKAGALHRANGG